MVLFIYCSSVPNHLLPKEDDSAKALLEKARNLYELGHIDTSLDVYSTLLDRYPDEDEFVAWALYEKGFILFEQKKWEESLIYFEKVVKEYEEKNPGAYILAYKFYRRIKYAYETGNMEVLIHNSSYAIPEEYDPNKPDNENQQDDTNNNNIDETDNQDNTNTDNNDDNDDNDDDNDDNDDDNDGTDDSDNEDQSQDDSNNNTDSDNNS
jgi:tetratricopeptide (TPR) repeat protein